MAAIILHCSECYKQLQEYGKPCIDMYLTICDLFIDSDSPVLSDVECRHVKTSEKTIMKFLEEKGYLVTTDACDIDKEVIWVKPKGYKIKKDLHTFCPLGCKGDI